MSIYYLETSTGIYELDATLKVKFSNKGKLTSNVIEDKESVADHYANLPKEFTLMGTITDIDGERDTRGFISGLTKVKESGERITIFLGDIIQPSANVVITALDLEQNSRYGSVNGRNSFSVKISLKQARLVNQIEIIETMAPEYQDAYATTEEGSGAASEKTGEPSGAIRSAVGRLKITEAFN